MGQWLQAVYPRTTLDGPIKMHGCLHFNRSNGTVAGWVTHTWTDPAITPSLPFAMYWVAHENGKLYDMRIHVDLLSVMEMGNEAADAEPQRVEFIRATLARWEQEYLEQQAGA
jgi:hypothetical protein